MGGQGRARPRKINSAQSRGLQRPAQPTVCQVPSGWRQAVPRAVCGWPRDIDRVGIGPAIQPVLHIGLARHDLAAMLVLRIVPRRGRAAMSIFEGLILRRPRRAGGLARPCRGRSRCRSGRRPPRRWQRPPTRLLRTADGRAGDGAGGRAHDGAGALLIAWPARRHAERQHENDRKLSGLSHRFPLRPSPNRYGPRQETE